MILSDVNIFTDVFRKRKGWETSLEIVIRVRSGKLRGFISAITVPILWWQLSREISENEAKKRTGEIIRGFEIVNLSDDIISDSFKIEMEDLEDALQFFSAKKANCRTIITRNKKDFTLVEDKIEILSPEEYLEKHGGIQD